MWDSNAPLQLLKTMPKKLSKENLEKIQMVLDADKYKNSLISGFDLCGMYAPFCRGCKKTSIYPCAIAYINMVKAGGMDVEIDAKPIIADADSTIFTAKTVNNGFTAVEEKFEPSVTDEIAVTASVADEVIADEDILHENVAVEKAEAEEEVQVAVEQAVIDEKPPLIVQQKSTVKRKIRIAVARKKI